jgi:hypothetical protein
MIMSPTELKMQPTIHLQRKPRPYPGLLYKCIVGCIFSSVELIITCKIPCLEKSPKLHFQIFFEKLSSRVSDEHW